MHRQAQHFATASRVAAARPAFEVQRFTFVQRDRIGLCPAAAPATLRAIRSDADRAAAFGLKPGHHRRLPSPPVADNDELLLLEGMQPRNKDMGLFTTCEGQVGHRDVGNRLVQLLAALRGHLGRLLSDKRVDHGQVVGCKRPENVLFAPYLSEVEPVRIDIF